MQKQATITSVLRRANHLIDDGKMVPEAPMVG
jgi:hypothetical protein